MPCMLAAHVIPPHFSRILATGLFSLLSVISVCTLVILPTQASWVTDVLPYNDPVLKVPHQRPSWMEESSPNHLLQSTLRPLSLICSFLWYLTPGTLRFPGYGDPLIRPHFHCLHPYVFYCSSLDSQIYDCNHSLALHASVLNPALLLHAAPVNWTWLAEKFTTALMCLIQIHDLNAVWQSQHMSSSCHSLILQTTISYLSLPRILLPLTSSPLSLELNLAFSFTEYTEAMWREFHRFRHHFYPPNSIYTLILCFPAGSHSDLVMFLLKADFSSST